MARTGFKGYSQLEQYDTVTGLATGTTKPNAPGDPDYVAPVLDLSTCPVDDSYVQVFRVYQNGALPMAVTSGGVEYKWVVKDGSSWESPTHFETSMSAVSSPQNLTINGGSSQVKTIFLVVEADNYAAITEIKGGAYNYLEAYMNNFPNLTTLLINGSLTIPTQNLTVLQINQCIALEKLEVSRSRLNSLNLSPNVALKEINVSNSSELSSFTIGNYVVLERLICYGCMFTSISYSTSIIDSIIRNWNAATPGSESNVLSYGSNSTSGIQPSSLAKPAYDSLVSKGFTITGKPPIAESVTLTANIYYQDDFSCQYGLQLSQILEVDLLVTGHIEYYNLGSQRAMVLFSEVIPAGDYQKEGEVYWGDASPNPQAVIEIVYVSPNPANGKNIVFRVI